MSRAVVARFLAAVLLAAPALLAAGCISSADTGQSRDTQSVDSSSVDSSGADSSDADSSADSPGRDSSGSDSTTGDSASADSSGADSSADSSGSDSTTGDSSGDSGGSADSAPPIDADGDGYPSVASGGGDCDDTDAAVNPGAAEVCNGVDDDCNGSVDDGLPIATYYTDADGDGYGADGTGVDACAEPAGSATVAGDCDETDAAVNPGAVEVCDGVDNNCDGVIDLSEADPSGTGTFGAATLSDAAAYRLRGNVYQPAYDVTLTSFRMYVTPNATSTVFGVYKATSPTGPYTWVDATSVRSSRTAGWVDSGVINLPLEGGAYYVLTMGDTATTTFWYDTAPSADAVGLSLKGGLDTASTASGPDAGVVYAQTVTVVATPPDDQDADGDGYTPFCGDCDDAEAGLNPAAAEVCDGVDNDCDGVSDEGFDADGDGYGACVDCDDGDASVSPGASEVCDGIDNDCSGAVDDNAVDGTTYYADSDGDGYGDVDAPAVLCAPASGYVADATDCDDGEAGTNPGAAEVCDSADNDCDGLVDEGFDGDGDGFPSCTDCNDADSSVYPGAVETVNGVDDNCDGAVDSPVAYAYTGAEQTYTVPDGVTSLTFEAWGGGGGGGHGNFAYGGGGGYIKVTVAVSPGDVLTLGPGQGGPGYGGGGGGSFGWAADGSLLFAAGGGGGGADYTPDLSYSFGYADGGGAGGADGESGGTMSRYNPFAWPSPATYYAYGGGGGSASAGGAGGVGTEFGEDGEAGGYGYGGTPYGGGSQAVLDQAGTAGESGGGGSGYYGGGSGGISAYIGGGGGGGSSYAPDGTLEGGDNYGVAGGESSAFWDGSAGLGGYNRDATFNYDGYDGMIVVE